MMNHANQFQTRRLRNKLLFSIPFCYKCLRYNCCWWNYLFLLTITWMSRHKVKVNSKQNEFFGLISTIKVKRIGLPTTQPTTKNITKHKNKKGSSSTSNSSFSNANKSLFYCTSRTHFFHLLLVSRIILIPHSFYIYIHLFLFILQSIIPIWLENELFV